MLISFLRFYILGAWIPSLECSIGWIDVVVGKGEGREVKSGG